MATQSKLNRSEILASAWAIRKQTGLNWSECQRSAWRAARLRSALHTGAISFKFTKEDGTTRAALGTLCPSLFHYESKGAGKSNPAVIKYFDLEAGAFRSFRIERLLAA